MKNINKQAQSSISLTKGAYANLDVSNEVRSIAQQHAFGSESQAMPYSIKIPTIGAKKKKKVLRIRKKGLEPNSSYVETNSMSFIGQTPQSENVKLNDLDVTDIHVKKQNERLKIPLFDQIRPEAEYQKLNSHQASPSQRSVRSKRFMERQAAAVKEDSNSFFDSKQAKKAEQFLRKSIKKPIVQKKEP